VDLGTRCTVFMNSSVKQAQKDGAKVEDISAGLSNSVVKNAIYKVIRVTSADELGENIVVQGGTFLNDAVLRCFEREIGHNCIRPDIAGLMGAYGAALYAKSVATDKSTLISKEALKEFTHTSKSAVCKGCTNNCKLTVNIFNNGEKFISGNQCKKGESAVNKEDNLETIPNMFNFKRELLQNIFYTKGTRKETIGLPLALGMYELAPLWHGILTHLGFSVKLSGFSDREIYAKGQFSIPSDTACYPAKITHGHIEKLIEENVDAIFFPCLSYNINEKRSSNHYNCPVVAYYPELLKGNMDNLKKTKFIAPFLTVNDKKELAKELTQFLSKYFDNINLKDVKQAVKYGFEKYDEYMIAIKEEGQRCIEYAEKNNKRLMILAGRPYHIDPEISHGIDKLSTALDFVVVTEDAVCDLPNNVPQINVLNQWTYHSRLYAAAQYAAEHKNTEFVQLVSFGCGIDAITTDEVRSILEENNKLYTQIKIDEITNLGAVKIRLRSLLGALEERS
ncbi:MAG: acyl-CoA dehydratase activase-related protein, partial [Acutalibacteraceae bacterium]